MDSPRRSIIKAVSWQLVGLAVSFAVGTGFTGDVAGGARIALTLAVVGGVLFTLHERLWARVRWGIEPG